MKSNCKFCIHSCKVIGKKECNNYKTPNVEDDIKERNRLLVLGNNPERVKELQKNIDFVMWGIEK